MARCGSVARCGSLLVTNHGCVPGCWHHPGQNPRWTTSGLATNESRFDGNRIDNLSSSRKSLSYFFQAETKPDARWKPARCKPARCKPAREGSDIPTKHRQLQNGTDALISCSVSDALTSPMISDLRRPRVAGPSRCFSSKIGPCDSEYCSSDALAKNSSNHDCMVRIYPKRQSRP